MSAFSAFPPSWEIKELRDVLISIIDGDRGKNYPSKEEFSPEGFCLFLNTGNIQNDSFDFTNCDFITEHKDSLLRKGKLLRNDIVLTTRGTVGSIGYYHRGIQYDHVRINSGMVVLRCSSSLSSPYFYQLFKSQPLKTQFELYSSGSAQPQLPIRDLRRVKLPVPKRTTQEKIAAILSTYDEQIDNSKQRIVTLEKLAEEIYREWFVRLRFPGHRRFKVVKGIPLGWSFDKASTFFGLVKGKSYAGDEITDDPDHMPFVNLKSFNRGGGYREDGLKYYSGRYKDEQVVRQNDVVVAVTDMTQDRAVVGRPARIPNFGERGAVISLDAVKLVPHNINKTFLYAYMRHSGFSDFIKEFANGANVLHLKPDLITKQKIIIPPRDLQDGFALKANLVYAQVDFLSEAVQRLTMIRHRLIPRLVSGKLVVENLDIQFPPGMMEELNAGEGSASSSKRLKN